MTTLNENVVLSDDIEITVIPNAGLGLSVTTSRTVVPFSSAFKLVSSSPMLLTNVEPQAEIILTGMLFYLNSTKVKLIWEPAALNQEFTGFPAKI